MGLTLFLDNHDVHAISYLVAGLRFHESNLTRAGRVPSPVRRSVPMLGYNGAFQTERTSEIMLVLCSVTTLNEARIFYSLQSFH